MTTLARPDAEARKTQLTLAPAASVPLVWGDRVQLQQVVLNLLINAMDAMNGYPPEARRVALSVTSLATGVEVAVTDSGHGIPEENLKRVFDSFFTTKPNGLGMGLAISQSIIAAHGGRLAAENNANGGATFRMRLPASGEGKGK